jgi:uncharacterized protein YkwD
VLLGSGLVAAPADAKLSSPEKSLLAAMNKTREHYGLPPLQLDPALERAARAHTKDMVRRRYFNHGPFFKRMEHYKVRGRVMGENLAYWPGSGVRAARIVRIWLHSPEHRANLLRAGFRRVGVSALAGRFAGGKVRMVTADFAGR